MVIDSSMFSLENKTAVITGGGSGIGRAIAELFARQGATVFILELNSDAASDTLNTIHSKGGKAFAFSCNVADQSVVNEVMGKIITHSNSIDILVNSAGIAHIGKLED